MAVAGWNGASGCHGAPRCIAGALDAEMDYHALLEAVLADYRLPPMELHGISHWARVLEIGRRLAVTNGARVQVVELFALLTTPVV